MRSLRISVSEAVGPFRLGGLAPRLPLSFDVERYGFFGSFPWLPNEALTLSLFVSTDDDELFDSERAIEGPDGAVKLVLHSKDISGTLPGSPFFKSVYTIEVGEEVADEGEWEGEVFQTAAGNKFWGNPAVIHESTQDLVDTLRAEGYQLYLQLDTPSYGEPHLAEGLWPFSDGMFFLFYRPDAEVDSLKWIWEHG